MAKHRLDLDAVAYTHVDVTGASSIVVLLVEDDPSERGVDPLRPQVETLVLLLALVE